MLVFYDGRVWVTITESRYGYCDGNSSQRQERLSRGTSGYSVAISTDRRDREHAD